MPRVLASAGLLLSLAGCAAPAPGRNAHAARVPGGQWGTIVAMRPVPAVAPRPVRRLLRGFGDGRAATDATEFIVRTDAGATLSIVQVDQPALHTGERVGILPATPARITAEPGVLAAR